MTIQELLEKMPSALKVGTQTYTVTAVADLKHEDVPCNGVCEEEKLMIQIESQQASKAQIVDTAVHELLHAIWYERNLPKKPDEERAVHSLATGLVALFQDNPKLLDWIKKGLK